MNNQKVIVRQVVSKIEFLQSEEIYNRFISYLDVSESSVRTYSFGVRKFLRYIGENSIKQPTRETVLNYKKQLEQNCKPATTALYLSAIRKFFEWCDNAGYYPNITENVKSPKQDNGHKRDALSREQLRRVLNSMKHETQEEKRNYAMFLLKACCGLRTIEVRRANIEDIREIFTEKVLFIQSKGKVSKGEIVKLPKVVLEAIKEYLQGRDQVKDTEPLFTSESNRNRGQRLTTCTISGICKNAMKKAGYDSVRLTAHSLRHSAVTIVLLNGASLQEVQSFARHSNLNTTLIYSHNLDKLKSKCEQGIAEAIFSAA